MSRQSPCANSKATGCEGFVTQKGVIFCEGCTELRKNMNKARREQSFEDLVGKNKELEVEVQNLRKSKHEIEAELKEKKELLEKGKEQSKYIVYNDQLEKENNRLGEMLVKLRSENDTLVKERENYHILYSQLNIDNQKLVLENIRLLSANESLREQNVDLQAENEMIKSK